MRATLIANGLWHSSPKNEITAERVHAWLADADTNTLLVVVMGLTMSQFEVISSAQGLDGAEVYEASDGTVTVRWISDKVREFDTRRTKEHPEMLLILQEALIDVSEQDTDLASKLAVRAYVNLKTDPSGHRRLDGLLHRFTGVLHQRPKVVSKNGPDA